MSESETIHLICPAKINMNLSVNDFSEAHGKHILQSKMVKISLHDTMEVRVVERKKVQITVTGPFSKGVPNNEHNIIYKAITLFFAHRARSKGFEITLTKNIPNGSGLGGGSSNAAEILKFLHEYYEVPLVYSEYVSLGSDIPFFLSSHLAATVNGVGEMVTECANPVEDLHGILIPFPQFPISTSWAFSQLAQRRENNISNSKNYTNDFQEMIFSYFYDIEKTYHEILKQKPLHCGITGSGSTLFAFFASSERLPDFSFLIQERSILLH